MNARRLAIVAVVMLSVAVCFGLANAQASIGSFVADSNQFGYTGTVQNTTHPSSTDPSGAAGPWTFPSPRDASLCFTMNVPDGGPEGSSVSNYNDLESNWYQHPQSNTNAGFFQINDGGTVVSATGGWTQEVGGLWDFTLTVTGANATYANSSAAPLAAGRERRLGRHVHQLHLHPDGHWNADHGNWRLAIQHRRPDRDYGRVSGYFRVHAGGLRWPKRLDWR